MKEGRDAALMEEATSSMEVLLRGGTERRRQRWCHQWVDTIKKAASTGAAFNRWTRWRRCQGRRCFNDDGGSGHCHRARLSIVKVEVKVGALSKEEYYKFQIIWNK